MAGNDKKLFLIDAMALIYRAHFAFIKNPRFNSKGVNTSAVLGFTNSLIELLEKEKPSHIAVAFDTYAPTVRHLEFAEYKANRDKQPEDITFAIPIIKKMLEAFKIPVVEMEGYEADDIIGTLAKSAARKKYTVFMVTPDKDYAQLVDEYIFIYKPSRMGNPPEIWDAARVKAEFGIKTIEQVVDIQGLAGDSVDNIPGVPGIGPKNAQKLISEFESIENLVKNTDKLKDKQKELIEKYAGQALLSKKLATIITDVPVNFDEKAFEIEEPDHILLENIFNELEFKNLSKRLLGKEPAKNNADALLFEMAGLFNIPTNQNEEKVLTANDEIPEKFHLLNNDEELAPLAEKVKEIKNFCFHVEKINNEEHFKRGLGIAVDGSFYYFIADFSQKEKLTNLIGLFEDSDIKKTGYDLKQLILFLNGFGIKVNGELFDLMIAHYLIDSESRHDLDFLSERYLGYKFRFSEIFSTGESIKNYFCEKAFVIESLSGIFKKDIDENKYKSLFYDIESPLISVLAKMETEGIKIDKNILNEYSVQLFAEMSELEKEIYKLSGVAFNLNSPMQLGRVLFDIMKIYPNAKKTVKSKQYSTSEDVLQKLAPDHIIAQKLLDYRSLQKLKSTYVDALPVLIRPETGRVHTSFNQAVTSTGRLSSTNPNMQNIPIRTDRGRFIRKAFIPAGSDFLILSADYSQVELRIIADISEDESMIEAFMQGLDIHTSTAAKIYNVLPGQVSPEMRRKAKIVNFGIIYGISGWGLAQRLDIPRKEGEIIISQYFEKFPRIKIYMNDAIKFAMEKGYVETLLGRKRYIREINSRNAMQRGFAERNAINAPIQGSAADMIKIAMVSIEKEIESKKLKSRMTLQVHDELVFDMFKDEKEILSELVKDKMENAINLKVPVVVEIGIGENWLDAH